MAAMSLGAAILVACGSGSGGFGDGTFAIIANTDIGAGEVPARILIGMVGEDGARLGDPETQIEVEVAPATDLGATQRAEAEFDWIVENAVGLYRASFVFDSPGVWWMTVEPQGGAPLDRVAFNVTADTATPNVGEPAVVTATPTLRDFDIVELTTDPEPDPRFYELSLDEAISNGRRTVLTFSTPAYCQTAACGPLLQTVKDTADAYPDTNFIHVEVYTGLTDPDFAPDPAHLAPSVAPEFWNLPSEPWVFVIDSHGLVTARFEGVMSAKELTDALG